MKVLALLAVCLSALAQTPARPRITGVAHIALYVADVEKSRTFYKGLLGFAEPFDLKNADGSLSLTFIKINDRQYIELFPEREKGSDRLAHIALETEDAELMRRYLASRGFHVPGKAPVGRTGNANFTIRDPNGHLVEFVQYFPGGAPMKEKGKSMPETRISTSLMHVGIIVNALEPAMAFYRDLLGFTETWRGSRDQKVLNWINLKVPDGSDYIEFMLHDPVPAPTQRGTAHHLCLAVPDIEKAAATLRARAATAGYTRAMEVRTGINRRRQLNLYDPDGTRTELMEPHTVDGQPPPPSTAPWPK